MSIQIFGTKKSNDTKKAERYFKERGIKIHFRNLSEKGLAKGEFDNICAAIPPEELLDEEGKQFKKRNLQFMVYNLETELLEDPLLLKMPIVRNGKKVTIGYQPDVWKKWIDEE